MQERRHYSNELKAEAVKMVDRCGLTHAAVARRLGVSKGSIGNWNAIFKEDTLSAWPIPWALHNFAKESLPVMRS